MHSGGICESASMRAWAPACPSLSARHAHIPSVLNVFLRTSAFSLSRVDRFLSVGFSGFDRTKSPSFSCLNKLLTRNSIGCLPSLLLSAAVNQDFGLKKQRSNLIQAGQSAAGREMTG